MRPTVPDRKVTPNGMILVNKQPGVTSFQALYPLKRVYGKGLGHTGTLDQFAQGLLVVLTGKFTKFTPFFTDFDKVYEADFFLGRETSTLDPEGETVFTGAVPGEEQVLSPLSSFLGPQLQIPPTYSAIHVDGKRAYERVRAGEVLVMEPRPVTFHSIEVLRWASPVLTLRIHCSKGTYIRSLARDWGRAVGCGAYVSRLVRHRVGPFELPEETARYFDTHETLELLGIPVLLTNRSEEISRGLPVDGLVPELKALGGDRVGLWSEKDGLVAVAERQTGRWGYLFVQSGGGQ